MERSLETTKRFPRSVSTEVGIARLDEIPRSRRTATAHSWLPLDTLQHADRQTLQAGSLHIAGAKKGAPVRGPSKVTPMRETGMIRGCRGTGKPGATIIG